MFGTLTPDQATALQPFVAGKVLYDLGAGHLELAHQLVNLGASQVVAVDKERLSVPTTPKIRCVRAYFKDLGEPVEHVFMSWPMNHYDASLIRLASKARMVIYLGKNTDCSACGTPSLFRHFLCRRVVLYKPERHNTLIVYRGRLKAPRRRPRGEERAGLDSSCILSFEEIEGIIPGAV